MTMWHRTYSAFLRTKINSKYHYIDVECATTMLCVINETDQSKCLHQLLGAMNRNLNVFQLTYEEEKLIT